MNNYTTENEQRKAITEEDKTAIGWIIHIIYAALSFFYIIMSLRFNTEFITTGFITTTLAVIVITCWLKGVKELLKTTIILLAGFIIFSFIWTKNDLQLSFLNGKYDFFIHENKNFANTENALIIREAINNNTEENYNKAFATIKNRDQNLSEETTKVFNLVNVVKNITPELKDELKNILADNFVSKEEYLMLKSKTIEKIQAKINTLNSEQLVLLGSIK